MPKTINATEAARSFSEIINSVKYRGESYTITKGGRPAAALLPIESVSRTKTLKDLIGLISNLPGLGKDAELFINDVETGIRSQPPVQETAEWE
ncbi:MAG: type II toxin-antitoxin system prevent-host-death family antitoxin [Dissulfurispiraceae bacterium]|jgi:prevent-host-death family protein|nr:type II toxin-antitoxin system prevent-host-death family antitoxin [Dissulfurispiraceae bacterium]